MIVGLLSPPHDAPKLTSNGLWGYINVSVDAPPPGFDYGVSLYSAAWPLLEKPIANFQIGLASTWIMPDNRSVTTSLVAPGTVARETMPERGPSFSTVFQTIEGGLGFWASNRWLAPTAKFRMNGTPDGYDHEISTPGWEFGGKPLPPDQMGIAQISSRILIPPDGVTLDRNTCGQLFGYAWMALPLLAARTEPVPTGPQCWTAFFNAKNFRGPVAFYLPTAWSRMSRRYPPAVGRGLDTLPAIADSGAIEINTVPQFTSGAYAKIPQLQFPANRSGQTVLMQDFTVYSKGALWNQVEAWRNGAPAPKPEFEPKGAFLPAIHANPLQVRQGTDRWVDRVQDWVSTTRLDPHTFGLQWAPKALANWKGGIMKASFPDYYLHEGAKVTAISKTELPPATNLQAATFPAPGKPEPYVLSPEVSPLPAPKAGPFKARLADGSVVTYYWYRFADQPSLQRADLTEADKANLLQLVEKMQRNWTPTKQYIPGPKIGQIASLDSALLVTPPKGLEIGYVPIATRQE